MGLGHSGEPFGQPVKHRRHMEDGFWPGPLQAGQNV